MKKIDLGQAITILANVGVIAGIVFLGYELRQNNTLLRFDAEQRVLERRTETATDMIRDPSLALAVARNRDNEDLTVAERERIRWLARRTLHGWEWEYRQFANGLIDSLPVSAWRIQLNNTSELREAWESMQATFLTAPDFVQFMHVNVIDPDQ